MRDGLHAREEAVEVRGDDLLERNEPLAVGEHEEARQEGRHLDACEALLAGHRVAHHHREVQRQVRDVRERVRRVDRQGGQHREHALVEDGMEVLPVHLGQLVPVADPDAGLVECRGDLAGEDGGLAFHHRLHPGADRAQLLGGVEAIG